MSVDFLRFDLDTTKKIRYPLSAKSTMLGRPEKKKIISRWRGYHGSGLMTGSLTGLGLFHSQFDLPLPRCFTPRRPIISAARTPR